MAGSNSGKEELEEIPSNHSEDAIVDGANGNVPGRLNVKDLEQFLKDFEQYKWQELMAEEQQDARRQPDQREIMRRARASKARLEELKDIMVRDPKRGTRRYSETEIIKKIVSLGPNGCDPEVMALFDVDEKGEISFENMKKISDLLGPYAFRLDLEVPNFVESVFSFEHLVSVFRVSSIIRKVGECIDDLAYSFDGP